MKDAQSLCKDGSVGPADPVRGRILEVAEERKVKGRVVWFQDPNHSQYCSARL